MSWLSQAFSTYILHPLHGSGYQFWSGLGSDFGEATILTAIVATAKHKNCHHKRCWRLGHNHPQHGWPSCKKHWRDTPAHV